MPCFQIPTGVCKVGAYIPPYYIHDDVLVLFSYAMPTLERNRTELGTKQERIYHPEKTPMKTTV
jgi:hypothetical protein